MEKLIFDSGIKEYQINDSGVLRFNPTDPNVYNRFFVALEKMKEIEAELTKRGNALPAGDGTGTVAIMVDADTKVKALLAEIFGQQNDFNAIFDGVNMMAVGSNGERVITNFLDAMLPIMLAGAEKCVNASSAQAVAQAKAARAARK